MIEELLEAVIQGSQSQQQQSRQRQAPANPWMDLMEDVLGGQQSTSSQPRSQTGAASLGMGDLLEMVLGGGGRQGAVGGNPLLAPFTNMLSESLGISPQMASVIVSAAFGLLMGKMGGGAANGATANPRDLANGLDLDDLLDGDFLKKNGVTEKVAKQTGMDPKEAEESLMKALEMLGLERGKKVKPESKKRTSAKSASKSGKAATKAAPKKAPKSRSRKKQADLQHLLDDWKVHG